MKNAVGAVHRTYSLRSGSSWRAALVLADHPCRDKERFMANFYDQRFPSHNKSARCAKVRPAVSTMRRPPGTAKHTGMEDRNNEAQFKLCLECIEFSSFYLHPRWRRTSRCQERCVLQHECCGGSRLDSAGEEPGRNHPRGHSECPRKAFSGSPQAT